MDKTSCLSAGSVKNSSSFFFLALKFLPDSRWRIDDDFPICSIHDQAIPVLDNLSDVVQPDNCRDVQRSGIDILVCLSFIFKIPLRKRINGILKIIVIILTIIKSTDLNEASVKIGEIIK